MRQDPLITFIYLSMSSYPKCMDKGVCHSWLLQVVHWQSKVGCHRMSQYLESGGLSAAQVPSKWDSLQKSLLHQIYFGFLTFFSAHGPASVEMDENSSFFQVEKWKKYKNYRGIFWLLKSPPLCNAPFCRTWFYGLFSTVLESWPAS